MLTRDEFLIDMHDALATSDAPKLGEITRIDEGFRLQETDEFIVEVHRMLFNWRLIVRRPELSWEIEHGFCFFGTDLATLARAVAVGLEWDDPLHATPTGFDKQAY